MIKSSEDIVVGDLISRRVPFFVPKYQRNYSWEQDEVDDFIDDIIRLCERRVAAQPQRKHFFGGLVSIDSIVPQSMSGRAFELVDGQQRMATFIMAISLLVQACEKVQTEAQAAGDANTAAAADAQAKLITSSFLIYQEVIGNRLVDQYRLTLSKADAGYFQLLLKGTPPQATRESHRLLLWAYNRIKTKLIEGTLAISTFVPAVKLDRLLIGKAALCEDCHVIHIYSDDKREAYSLFRILNDRGRPLGDGDKLRSHTLETLESNPALQATAEQQWDDILSIGQDSVEGFLQSFFTSQEAEKAPKRELFDRFVERVLQDSSTSTVPTTDFVAQKISRLHAAKNDYLALLQGDWPYPSSTVSMWKRDRLFRLMQVLRHSLSLPLLMAMKALRTEAEFVEVVLLLERFAFRYVSIVGAHHNPPNTVYATAIRRLRGIGPAFTVADLRNDLQGLITRYAPDSVFESNFFGKLKYNMPAQRRLIKHFLTTLEDYRSWLAGGAVGAMTPDESRVLDMSTNTIEHIYPQNAQATHQDAALEIVKQDIANLTFWGASDNQAAGNLLFVQKTPMYQTSSIVMNQQLSMLGRWTLHEYTSREASLWEAARKMFAI